MGLTRTLLFIGLTFYLILGVYFTSEMSESYSENIATSGDEDTLKSTCLISLFSYGFFCFEPSGYFDGDTEFSLLTDLDVPASVVWVQVILVALPFLFWIFLLIGFFVPTLNQGG